MSKDLSRTYFEARTFICILNLFSFSDFRRSISVTSPSPRWVFKLLVACCWGGSLLFVVREPIVWQLIVWLLVVGEVVVWQLVVGEAT